jgi:chemotaxis protein MotB
MRRRNKQPVKADEWLLTYSDLVTLLLVFFVFMYAFSRVDVEKFEGFVSSFQAQGILMDGTGVLDQSAPEREENLTQQQSMVEGIGQSSASQQLYEMAVQHLEGEGLLDLVEVSYEEGGIALDIKEAILFDSGNAVLKPGARELLNRLAGFFSELPNQIVVEGHTDNRRINTLRYPSNWELSVDRAAKVVRYLTEEEGLNPRKFTAVGYGEYRPVVPNTSPENQAMNRRVMIVIKTNEVPSEVSGN